MSAVERYIMLETVLLYHTGEGLFIAMIDVIVIRWRGRRIRNFVEKETTICE